jgi:hypothetical protein
MKSDYKKSVSFELKKRKKKHEASIVEEKESTKKTKQDGRDFFY